MEDWMLPSPSPRTLMPSLFNEEFSLAPFSNIFSSDDRSNKASLDEIEKSKTFLGLGAQETSQEMKDHPQIESNLFGANQKPTSPGAGGLAERMAARAGFGVLKIDTTRVSSSGAAAIRSPVTIPPGVSPRELLESPVFLPNALSQPSPTTGKLPFLMPNNFKSTMPSVPEKSEDSSLHEGSVFSFQPILRSKPSSTLWTAEKGSSVVQQTQSLATMDSQESNLHANHPTATKHETEENLVKPKAFNSMFDNDHHVEPEQSEEIQNGEDSSATNTGPAEDGYNWRSYGHKKGKNGEHPRVYYKCTHPRCPVKKKVEHSLEGHIIEIVYRGSHSHPLPLPDGRPSVPLSQSNDAQAADGLENFSSKPAPGYNSATSQGIAPNGQFQDVHSRALETKLSAGSLTTTEIADTSVVESMDVSSKFSSNEKGDRATMHGAIPSANDMNEDETESKRRKMEVSAATSTTNTGIGMAAMAASRTSVEPRIVVQTTSEVDILDDGYRWRKYGQKVVKGNPNPRSYYKCTYEGCSVRKHVERASNDLKSVITTYEGKHNHQLPVPRSNNGHPSSGSGAAPAPQGSSFHRRLEPPQVSIPQPSAAAAAYGSFCLPPQRIAAASGGGFSFGMLPHGMAMPLPVPSLGNFIPAQMMPGHGSPMQGCTAGLMMPSGGDTKVNPEQQSTRLPVANGNAAATYQQQLMGRWPQGHQM